MGKHGKRRKYYEYEKEELNELKEAINIIINYEQELNLKIMYKK